MPVQHLAVVDTVKIHDYVFSATELSQIRGASQLLSDCTNERWRSQIRRLKGREIFCSGGNALALFDDADSAWEFCRQAETILARRTITARAASHVEPGEEGEIFPGRGAGCWKQRALDRLNEVKQAATAPVWGEPNPYVRFCDFCGVRGAERGRTKGGRWRWLCRSCAAKEPRGENIRGPRSYWLDRFTRLYGAPAVRPPKDLNALGETAKPRGYLALVYLDINRLGTILDRAGSTDEYRAVSDAVSYAVERSIYDALRPRWGESEATALFEIFLIGGDDAVLALPAQFAADFVEQFFKNFDGNFPRKLGEQWGPQYAASPPRVSVGILYAHSHFPASMAIDLADGLMRGAKKKAWLAEREAVEAGLDYRGSHMIDYMAVTNALEKSPEDLRKELRQGGVAHMRRPLDRDEFARMRSLCERMKGIPRSKIAALYDLMLEGEHQSKLDYCYWLTRLEGKTRTQFQEEAAEWGIFEAPFDRQWSSPILDAVELLDFVRG
jgi:hypothetical protein